MTSPTRHHPSERAIAIRYQQRSAEVKALQRQCYALATLRLRAAVEANGTGKGLAVVSDIDETILDNTAVMAHAMTLGEALDGFETWKLWEREGAPHLLPGAADFFNLADRLGVTIFYVSDRFEENKLATIATLSRLGLPQVTWASELTVEGGTGAIVEYHGPGADSISATISRPTVGWSRALVISTVAMSSPMSTRLMGRSPSTVRPWRSSPRPVKSSAWSACRPSRPPSRR